VTLDGKIMFLDRNRIFSLRVDPIVQVPKWSSGMIL